MVKITKPKTEVQVKTPDMVGLAMAAVENIWPSWSKP
jgi:hypothetical protein